MRVSYEIQEHELAPHVAMAIWVNGAMAGTITVRRGAEEALIGAIIDGLMTLPSSGVPVEDRTKHECSGCGLPRDHAGSCNL